MNTKFGTLLTSGGGAQWNRVGKKHTDRYRCKGNVIDLRLGHWFTGVHFIFYTPAMFSQQPELDFEVTGALSMSISNGKIGRTS